MCFGPAFGSTCERRRSPAATPPRTPPGVPSAWAAAAAGARLADELTQRAELSCSDEDQEAHGTFLSCLDGLEQLSLTIEDVLDEGDTGENLIIRVLLLGGTTCRRLHTLKINTDGTLGAVGGHAVQVCCPSLRTLQLNTASVVLDFFQPLQACQSLAKISVTGVSPDGCGCLDTSEVLLAMSHLTGLRVASLGGYMAASNLAPLAALTSLRDLNLGALEVHVEATYSAVHIGRVLGGLTHLTCLDTPNWDTHQGEDPQLSIFSTLNGILAPLGSLRALASLTLHGYGPLQADGMAALRQLSALTHLDTPQLAQHLASSAGHVPRLQQLTIQSVHSSAVLAASWQPFLPLAALRAVSCGLRLLAVVGQADSDDGGLAVLLAIRFATQLAAAPRLRTVNLTVCCYKPDPLSAAAAAARLAVW